MAMGCGLGWRASEGKEEGVRGKLRESRREEIGRRGKEEGGGRETSRKRHTSMHGRGSCLVASTDHRSL